MLNFIIGTAGTGKTTYIMNKISELAKQGKKSIYIVPEQFSKTGESLLFSLLDKESAPRNLVQLHSFSSLKSEIERVYGKLAPNVLTNAGKAVMVRRAILNNKNILKLYKKQSESINFAYLLAGTFDDLKRSGVSDITLSDIVANNDNQFEKLKEISILYSEYRGLMGDKFCDEEDIFKIISEKLPSEYTENQNIFIDGFEHFSYGQLLVIKTMIEKADNVTVSIVSDSINSINSVVDIFSYTNQTIRTLTRYAEGKIGSLPVLLDTPFRFKSKNLALLDSVLQGGEISDCDKSEKSLFITEYPTQFEEICRAIAQIRKLLKEENYSYNDIAIVTPQLEIYEHQLQESLTLAGMPYFIDEGRIISTSRPCVFFNSILKIMSDGVNSENSLELLHTGLTDIDENDIALFENYLFVWQNTELDFSKDFELSPEGIKQTLSEGEQLDLDRVNFVRKFLYDTFADMPLEGAISGNEILTKCYQIAENLHVEQKLELISNDLGDSESRLLVRLWDIATECLDALNNILSGDTVSVDILCDLYSLMISGTSLEFSPETQDCIMVSQPNRMKLDAIKAVFILGAAEDIFPALRESVGLISDSDREILGLELDSDYKNQTAFENLYFYKALTTAQSKLYISYAEKNIGELQRLSNELLKLKDNINIPNLALSISDYALSKDFLIDYVSGVSDIEQKEKYISLLKKIGIDIESYGQKNYDITHKENLKVLLTRPKSKSMWISPTNVEKYYECPFEYFLGSVLRVRPLEKAQFDARMSGTYLHYIVEIVLKKYGESFFSQSEETIENDIDDAIADYIEKTFPIQIRNNPKFISQYENMRENAKYLLFHILDEQKHSRFRPVAFEKKIGDDGVPPIKITTDKGNSISIHGVIDRVDVYRGMDTDYLRIVDYKTGRKKFDESDIASGLSSQLLVYMNGLLQTDFAKMHHEMAAGAVMYQHSEVTPKKDDNKSMLYEAVGMSLDSVEILKAFGNDSKDGKTFGVIKPGAKALTTKDNGSIIASSEKFNNVLAYVTEKIKEMGDNAFDGIFPAIPLAEKLGERGKACSYCIYAPICMRAKQTTNTRLKTDKSVLDKIRGEKEWQDLQSNN